MFMYLQDAIEAEREQLTQNNETINENNMFLDVVGGQQKGRVYGLGSQATQYYNLVLPLLPHRHLMFLNKIRR